MLDVLHRVHASALLMMDTLEQWEVSSKNKNITDGACSGSTQHLP